MVVPRKISSRALLSRGTRLFENERKLTVWPSALMDGARLCPLEGDAFVPPDMLERATPVVQVMVVARQVLRTNIFSTPLVVFARFEASEANATNCPVALMLGCSLRPFPGVPLTVDTKVVEGTQVVVAVFIPVQVSRT